MTDYEVEYVREFNVRPVREGWLGTTEDNHRLDLEAEGARHLSRQPVKEPRRHSLWLWVAVTGVLVAVGAVATVFGFINLSTAVMLNRETSSIEADL